MLRYARMAVTARLAVALVALSLSGVPRVVAMHAPVEGHRCTCMREAGGHHLCSCALCRRTVLSVQASDGKSPPCHRAAARAALSSEEQGRDSAEPCIEGTCGSGARPPVSIVGVEPFCVPPEQVLAVALVDEERRTRAEPSPQRALEPETPPPRPA